MLMNAHPHQTGGVGVCHSVPAATKEEHCYTALDQERLYASQKAVTKKLGANHSKGQRSISPVNAVAHVTI